MSEGQKIGVGIVGAASYSSGKLIQLLLDHPGARITYLVSETAKSPEVDGVHSFLKDVIDIKYSEYDAKKISDLCDVVFMTRPHGYNMKYAPGLISDGIKVIDLSGDFRLKKVNLYDEWYQFKHEYPDLLEKSVYGLTEIYRKEIKAADLIANPGCYPTGIILGAAPLFKEKLVRPDVTAVSISGASGAGKRAVDELQYLNVSENIKAYKVGIHQHTPEIEQELSILYQDDVRVLFVPHLAPFTYGIITTINLKHKDNEKISEEEIYSLYTGFYENDDFIRIYKPGQLPEVKDVVGSNFCDIGFKYDKRTRTIIIVTAIDNLVKGGAGQAIQNMNVCFGLDETLGLPYSPALMKKRTGEIED